MTIFLKRFQMLNNSFPKLKWIKRGWVGLIHRQKFKLKELKTLKMRVFMNRSLLLEMSCLLVEMKEVRRRQRTLTGLGLGHVGQNSEGLGLRSGATAAPLPQIRVPLCALDGLVDRGGAVHRPLLTWGRTDNPHPRNQSPSPRWHPDQRRGPGPFCFCSGFGCIVLENVSARNIFKEYLGDVKWSEKATKGKEKWFKT